MLATWGLPINCGTQKVANNMRIWVQSAHLDLKTDWKILFFFLKDYRLGHRRKPDPDGRYYFISQENKTVQMWAHTLVPHRNTLPKEIDVKKFDCTCCSFSIYSIMGKKKLRTDVPQKEKLEKDARSCRREIRTIKLTQIFGSFLALHQSQAMLCDLQSLLL